MGAAIFIFVTLHKEDFGSLVPSNLVLSHEREPFDKEQNRQNMDEITLIIIGCIVMFVLLCLTVYYLLYLLGVSKPIDVKAGAPPLQNATVAYKFAKGPYKNSGQIFTEVALLCPDLKCIGLYYDNPNEIPAEKLRYAVGAILTEGVVKVDPELETKMLSEGYKIIQLPQVAHCVTTSFPFVNTISILIAVWRVYPKLNKYIKSHKLSAYPLLEIYEPDCIQFMAPLSQQEKFFVNEALDCVPEEYLDNLDADQSLLCSSARSSPTASERSSRSMSTFSRSYVSSRYDDDVYSDEESDFESSVNVTDDGTEGVQDNQISSSIDVRPSKACTNLLEDDIKEEVKDMADNVEDVVEELKDVEDDIRDTSGVDGETNVHDSGICSGQPSINQNDTDNGNDTKEGMDGNDSSSSFEEINMESLKAESALDDVVKNEL
ncbi:hypothetical protein ACF0H5_014176 [Mactra antiquata]